MMSKICSGDDTSAAGAIQQWLSNVLTADTTAAAAAGHSSPSRLASFVWHENSMQAQQVGDNETSQSHLLRSNLCPVYTARWIYRITCTATQFCCLNSQTVASPLFDLFSHGGDGRVY
jgi:hypothetical protein